jgi:hypothetical protein
MLALALTAVSGLGAAAAAGPAQAAHRPDLGTRWARLAGDPRFFANGYQLCIVSPGVGAQLIVKDPAGNFCARLSAVSDGGGVFLLADAHSHCIRASSAGRARMENCAPTDPKEQWMVFCVNNPSCQVPGKFAFLNAGTDGYLKVNSPPHDGYNVYVGTGGDEVWYLEKN